MTALLKYRTEELMQTSLSHRCQFLLFIGPVPNGTLPVHLRSWVTYGLTMAAVCTCPLSSRDHRVSHFSVQKGARELPLCGCYAPSIRTSAEHALGRAQSRLLLNSQSGITSRKCGLRGRPQGFRVPFGQSHCVIEKKKLCCVL